MKIGPKTLKHETVTLVHSPFTQALGMDPPKSARKSEPLQSDEYNLPSSWAGIDGASGLCIQRLDKKHKVSVVLCVPLRVHCMECKRTVECCDTKMCIASWRSSGSSEWPSEATCGQATLGSSTARTAVKYSASSTNAFELAAHTFFGLRHTAAQVCHSAATKRGIKAEC